MGWEAKKVETERAVEQYVTRMKSLGVGYLEIDLAGATAVVTDIGTCNEGINETITVPSFVSRIGAHAFSGVKAKEIEFAGDITSVGYHAFNSAEIAKIKFNGGLLSIGHDAFSYANIGELTIASSCRRIERSCFHQASIDRIRLLCCNIDEFPKSLSAENVEHLELSEDSFVKMIENAARSELGRDPLIEFDEIVPIQLLAVAVHGYSYTYFGRKSNGEEVLTVDGRRTLKSVSVNGMSIGEAMEKLIDRKKLSELTAW